MPQNEATLYLTLGGRFDEIYRWSDQSVLRSLVEDVVKPGPEDLIMMSGSFGFDAAVAEAVLENGYSDRAVLIAPFPEFYIKWPEHSQPHRIFARATTDETLSVAYTSPEYVDGVYSMRDAQALEFAKQAQQRAPITTRIQVVTFWNGKRGALSDSLTKLLGETDSVINLYPRFKAIKEAMNVA